MSIQKPRGHGLVLFLVVVAAVAFIGVNLPRRPVQHPHAPQIPIVQQRYDPPAEVYRPRDPVAAPLKPIPLDIPPIASVDATGAAAADEVKRGSVAASKGDYSTAINHFSKSIHLDPNLAQPYIERALVYENLGNKEKAINDFLKAIELSPGGYEDASKRRALANEHIASLASGTKHKSPEPNTTFSPNVSAQPPSRIQESLKDAPELELVPPALGCPDKLPRYASVQAICRGRDAQACNSERLCSWSKGLAQCHPKMGATVLPPDSNLSIDYAELIPFNETQAHVSKGNRYVASGQLDRAIIEYTSALQSLPDYPQALSDRAAAYELKGDSPRAIADYCRILVIGATRQRRSSALAHITQLTQQGRATNLQPSSPSIPGQHSFARNETEPLDKRPTTVLQTTRRRNAIAPLTIETDPGVNYLIKLINVADVKDQIMIYIKGGDTYSTKIPLGDYNVRGASGNKWYGKQDYFGPNTHFFRFQNRKGTSVGGPVVIRFSREGNTIHGKTLVLKNVAEGNMSQETISKNEF